MFEDSTFESTGKIHTHSRGWMIATFLINGSILMALILIPLIYPEALPHQAMIYLMEVPPAPHTPDLPKPQTVQQAPIHSEMSLDQFVAPRRIPTGILIASNPEPALGTIPSGWGDESAIPGGIGNGSPHGSSVRLAVRPENNGPVRVSSMVVAGLLVRKTVPVYPPIAVAARVEGTVVLQATISKSGTIENLHVAGGPAMLQQSALDAVRSWLYRPYLQNGEPVEVETTVNVVFKLAH